LSVLGAEGGILAMVLFAICSLAMTAALVFAGVVGMTLLFEIRRVPGATAELVLDGLRAERAEGAPRPVEEAP
jgi:hypothetical protein